MLLVRIYGILAGLTFGMTVTKLITSKLFKKSNDIGDSTGHFEDYSDGLEVICHEDNFMNVY